MHSARRTTSASITVSGGVETTNLSTKCGDGDVEPVLKHNFKVVEQNWHSESQATCDKLKGIEAAVIVFRENYLDTIAIDTLYKRVRAND
ncbi:MAG: hypothetical protein DMF72_19635 [Acidobacteria bacterium]|nr:MAG: hypothetical protein DMF72_19635 [Acidobacteriota bacterium]